MKVYNTVNEYLKEAKANDKVVFCNKENSSRVSSKYGTYTIVEVNSQNELIVKNYRSRTKYKICPTYYDQEIVVLNKKTYNQLSS